MGTEEVFEKLPTNVYRAFYVSLNISVVVWVVMEIVWHMPEVWFTNVEFIPGKSFGSLVTSKLLSKIITILLLIGSSFLEPIKKGKINGGSLGKLVQLPGIIGLWSMFMSIVFSDSPVGYILYVLFSLLGVCLFRLSMRNFCKLLRREG